MAKIAAVKDGENTLIMVGQQIEKKQPTTQLNVMRILYPTSLNETLLIIQSQNRTFKVRRKL